MGLKAAGPCEDEWGSHMESHPVGKQANRGLGFAVCVLAAAERSPAVLNLTLRSLHRCGPFPAFVHVAFDREPEEAMQELLLELAGAFNFTWSSLKSAPADSRAYWRLGTEKIVHCLGRFAKHDGPMVLAEDDVVFARQFGQYVSSISTAAAAVHLNGSFISLYDNDWKGRVEYPQSYVQMYLEKHRRHSEEPVETDADSKGSLKWCTLRHWVRRGWVGWGVQAQLLVGQAFRQELSNCIYRLCHVDDNCNDLGLNSCLRAGEVASEWPLAGRQTNAPGVYATLQSLVQHIGLASTIFLTSAHTDESLTSPRWHEGSQFVDYYTPDMPMREQCFRIAKFGRCKRTKVQ